MELWIRSQDKEALRKINCSLYLKRDLSDYAEGEVYFIVSSGDKLGEYKTKERALEVLDEIQKILKPQLIIKDSGKIIGSFEDTIIREGATYELKELSTYVYEMPEE
jgi:hypothetical protein